MSDSSQPVVLGIDVGNSKIAVSTIIGDCVTVLYENPSPTWCIPARIRFFEYDRSFNVGCDTDNQYIDDLKRMSMGIDVSRTMNDALNHSLEKLFSIILIAVKRLAENATGTRITHAMLTMPLFARPKQYQMMELAARLAKLETVQFLSEPVAACITWVHFNLSEQQVNLLVFDFGQNSLDVSWVTRDDTGHYQIMLSRSSPRISGRNMDKRIFRFLLDEFPPQSDFTALERDIKCKCEIAKCELSFDTTTTFDLNNLFSMLITREDLMNICSDQFYSFSSQVNKMKALHVDAVIAVGGCTRIPAVRKKLLETFGPDRMHWYGDFACSHGAAIYAADPQQQQQQQQPPKQQQQQQQPKQWLTVDSNNVIRRELGVYACDDKTFHKVVEKNTLLPCQEKITVRLQRAVDSPKTISVVDRTTSLGEILFPELTETVDLSVVFCLRVGGHLSVTVYDRETNVMRELNVTY